MFNQYHDHPNDPDSGFAATFDPLNTLNPRLTSSVQNSDKNAVLPAVAPNPDIVDMVSEAESTSAPEEDTPGH